MKAEKKAIAAVAVTLLAASFAAACNIPVFRYALERWQPDLSEAVVFYRGSLNPAETRLVDRLQAATPSGGGHTNLTVKLCDLDGDPSEDLASLWQSVAKADGRAATLPRLVVRTKMNRGRSLTHWSSPLDSASVSNVLTSPVRKELSQRMLQGDSVVWLLLRSPDQEKTQRVRDMLTESFARLEQKMTMPDGIGMPGSELFSDVPLLIQFSTIEVAPDDPQEQYLVEMLSRLGPRALAEGQPLLIPVFGRGRALEVIAGNDASAGLIEELTMFLGAACSCQVKEQNPGFDLLLNVDWHQELFGDSSFVPPPTETNGNAENRPILVPIPSGKKK